MSDHKAGDEVWVRVTIRYEAGCSSLETDDKPYVARDDWDRCLPVPLADIRTQADFKDPFDERIVSYAIKAVENYGHLLPHQGYLEDLGLAVKAKQDAAKPKTAEDAALVALRGLRDGLPVNRSRKEEADFIAQVFRDANLLKEDT